MPDSVEGHEGDPMRPAWGGGREGATRWPVLESVEVEAREVELPCPRGLKWRRAGSAQGARWR